MICLLWTSIPATRSYTISIRTSGNAPRNNTNGASPAEPATNIKKLTSALAGGNPGYPPGQAPASLSHPDTQCQVRTTSAGDAPTSFSPCGRLRQEA
ncbi:hypothetical protein Vau01_122780 [Virgisporangium aurantiacum]|uniref:Uncharacterized protein n=1 Tax=Virgisporangium aurantiacum TaxID=175570 RepID=A0A8J3ZKR6_9ACTN|nr:hypothetical protein Vau01_122780 [Virgisporangium aurantiacum]